MNALCSFSMTDGHQGLGWFPSYFNFCWENNWSPNVFPGETRGVEGTPFDLRKPVLIGPRLQQVPSPGFDHNFCLSFRGDPWKMRLAARWGGQFIAVTTHSKDLIVLHTLQMWSWKSNFACLRVCHPDSGRVLEVRTSQPGVQFYTANYLDGSFIGKDGMRYGKHSSFCLETQNWPDAVNQVGSSLLIQYDNNNDEL